MQVLDWQLRDDDTVLHLECECGKRFTGEESDVRHTCPSCGAEEKIKPHPKTCERCPNRYTLRGCPYWISEEHGFEETNVQTQETRRVTGCYPTVVMKMMQHVVQASNRPAAAVESIRNEITDGMSQVAGVMTRIAQQGPTVRHGDDTMGRIEDGSGEDQRDG